MDALDLASDPGNPRLAIPPDAYANILYTSGSTGKPKGVLESHGNLVYEALWRNDFLGTGPGDRASCFGSFSFSTTTRHFYPVIFAGACACVLDPTNVDTPSIIRWIHDERITIMGGREVLKRILPAMPAGEKFPLVRVVTMGGDTVYRADVESVARVFAPERIAVSLSSTEAGNMTSALVSPSTEMPGGISPVGTPAPLKRVLLLDENGREVSPGEAGEVAIVSRFMSAGYWKRPDLTAEKFRSVVGSAGERMFLTGDVGRWLPDGQLQHLGRKDFQVKVRGFRVETAEVEAALRAIAGVNEAVVLARKEGDSKALVAYLLTPGEKPTVSKVRAGARRADAGLHDADEVCLPRCLPAHRHWKGRPQPPA